MDPPHFFAAVAGPYPRISKRCRLAFCAGVVSAILTMLLCCWIGSFDPITPVSLSLAFRPWWRASNFGFAFLTFSIAFAFVFVRVALRPSKPPRQDAR